MKKTRVLSGILALLMLVAPLASCATENEPDDTKPSDQTTAVTEGETQLKDNLPDGLNYNGQEITVISRSRLGWFHDEMQVDNLTGEPVNDAIYERNKMVEERLGVKLINITDNDVEAYTIPLKVDTAVKAGTSEYDFMAAAAHATANTSLSGTFANLNSTQYLDLEQIWWTQGYNEALEYNDMQFSATGAIALTTYRLAFTTVFNKGLFDEANQPYLYDVVDAGKWTLDKQASLVPLFHRDNGNGTPDEQGDIFGFITNDFISVDPYWSACSMDFLGRDEEGDYQLIFNTGKVHDVTEKIMYLFYGTNGATYNIKHQDGDGEQEVMRRMFSEGLGAMATLRIMELESSVMRNTDQQYGVIPMPKFDEKQDSYHTLLHDQFTVIAIPTTVKDQRLHMVSAVLEAMASASYNTVRPAYYETTLRTKIAQDPQSAAMMDVITENIYIDAGLLYIKIFENFHSSFRGMIQGGVNDATSRFTAINKKSKSATANLNKKLDRLLSQQE